MKTNNPDRKIYSSIFSELISLGQYVWKHALLLLLAVALCAAATAGYFFRKSETTASMSLTLNYEEAVLGLAPNGEKIDMYVLHGNEVMGRALELAGIAEMTPEELAQCVSVSIKGASGFSLGDTTSYAIMTSYNITVRQNDSLREARISASTMLSLIRRAFHEYFAEKYIDKGVVIELTHPAYDELEYMERWELINMRANQLRSYLSSRSTAAPSFISRATGESFASLRQKMDNLIAVHLADCRAFLLEHGIAKERQTYISKLDYLNDALSRNRDKRKASYEIRMMVIDQYDGEMISTVLIPTENSNRKFYMSKTETGIDYLAVDANYDAVTVSTFQKQIDTNANILSHMRSKTANSAAEIEKANTLLQNVSDSLDEMLRLTQLTAEDYISSEANDYLLWHASRKSLKTQIGGNQFLALCGGYAALALFAAYSFKRRRKRG